MSSSDSRSRIVITPREHLWKADGEDLPFNTKLGAYHGVVSFSNRDDGFFSGQRHYTDGVHTGFSWQCVEFARRFTIQRKGLSFAGVGRSTEIYYQKEIKLVKTDEQVPWPSVHNGTTTKPVEGAIILWPHDPTLLPWGHVGVISVVKIFNEEDIQEQKKLGDGSKSGLAALTGRDGTGEVIGYVGIAEQNVENKSWGDRPYGRTIPIVCRADPNGVTYTLEEPEAPTKILDPLGWKPLPDHIADRGNSPLEPKTHDTFPQSFVTRTALQYQRPDWQALAAESSSVSGKPAVVMPTSFTLMAETDTHVNFAGMHHAQDEAGEKSVGGAHYAMSAVELTMKQLLKSSMDGELAEWFDMPVETIPLVRRHFSMSTTMAGSIVLGFHSNHSTLAGICLDSTDGFLETPLQDVMAPRNGITQGFSPATYAGDCRRALLHRIKYANTTLGLIGDGVTEGDHNPLKEPTHTIHFVDTTSAENHRERAQALSMYETFAKVAAEANGGGNIEGVPSPLKGVGVKWIAAADLRWNADKTLVVDADGVVVRIVKKSSPWAHIFNHYHPTVTTASVGTKKHTTDLYEMLIHSSLLVFEPLWAAMATHPTFLQFLFDFAKDGVFYNMKEDGLSADDTKQLLTHLNLTPGTFPESVWDQMAAGNTVHTTKAIQVPGSESEKLEEISGESYFRATRCFVFEGANACMLPIESPNTVAVPAGAELSTVCPVSQLTNVGIFRFIFD